MEDEKKTVIVQLESLLQKALEELNTAKEQRVFVEDLFSQTQHPESTHRREFILESAKTAVLAAEKANSNIRHILQQARELIKTDEENPNQSFLYIKEIKELKEFRDIVNAEGEASEEAFAARTSLTAMQNMI